MTNKPNDQSTFQIMETSSTKIQAAYRSGQLSAKELVQSYLDRIDAYDRDGPIINSIITVNPRALEDADALDAAFKASGPVGPLHGVPVILKDQIDARGMPTTLGSVVFKDYYPDRDAFVVEKLKQAGAIILAKATLGEMGRGDTHGALFGSTRSPSDRAARGGPSDARSKRRSTRIALARGGSGEAGIRRARSWSYRNPTLRRARESRRARGRSSLRPRPSGRSAHERRRPSEPGSAFSVRVPRATARRCGRSAFETLSWRL